MKIFGRMLILFYQIISTLILPILFLVIIWRKKKLKECPQRFLERFAITTKTRPADCQLLWLHAVSVGESNSAWNLIEELLKFSDKINILFTSTSTTSARIIEQKISANPIFQQRIIHQFLPLDSYFVVRKFLNYWRPRACIFIESEIWPNFVYCARKMGVLSFLINARISEKSAKKWQFVNKLGFNIFDYFSLIFAQSYKDKNMLQTLTKNIILYEGNLKAQNNKIDVDKTSLEAIKSQIGSRKIWLCSSTHKGEENIILDVHLRLKQKFNDLLTIVVLRHPSRLEEVESLFKNINYCVRSKNQNIDQSTQIYVVDTLGELGIFYSLTDFVFLGGSLLPVGGHNPIEAIQFGCFIITGKYFYNNSEIFENLIQAQTCLVVEDSEELYDAIDNILSNKKSENISSKVAEIIKFHSEVSQKIVTKIDKILMFNENGCN